MNAWVRPCRVVLSVLGLAACGSVQGPATGDDAGSGDGGVDGGIDAAPGQATSCVGLAATCGSDGHDNCCNSPDVVGGVFYRSFDFANDPPASGNTSFPATISDFRLDKYEVTVGRFRAFVNAGLGSQDNPPLTRSGAHANILSSGWDSSWNTSLPPNRTELLIKLKCDPDAQWTDQPGSNENRPMNCLTWFEAMAFCAWDGGYLPTEAEWNYAATGGGQQRAFPWSMPAASLTVDLQHASYNVDGMVNGPLLVVGSLPLGDGRWGQSDLAGNVAEWVLDFTAAYPSMCVDCANLATTASRQSRGGGFGHGKSFLRTAFRVGVAPLNGSSLTGVRCARPASMAMIK